MKQAIVMPKLGLSMTDGMITQWHVKVGDTVKIGDIVFTLETDKLTYDVEATAEGKVLEILHEQDDVVSVGKPCLYVG